MKILFLTDNFPPEVNAPATRTYEHCLEWVKQGVDVTVITCFPNFPQGKIYEGYRNKRIQKEIFDGIKVIRVWTYIAPNEGFIKRTLDFFSFAISAFLAGLTVKTDLIVATSPQFFTAACGRWLSVIKRKPWIMEVRDIWPESIKNVEAIKSAIALKYFELWEIKLYKTAKHIVVVTDSFKKNLSSRGIDPEKISVVKNGANLSLFKCRPKNSDIIGHLGLNNKTIISYIGTLGMAHKLDFILNSVKKINSPDYHFLFIGAGAEMINLTKLKEELELKNVTFIDAIQKKDVPEYLSITDISLINLRKSDLFKLVIPSKIFESAAMQKPILLGVDGESRQIIEKYHAGLCFEPENEDDFLEKLNLLVSDKELYKSYQDGCKKLAADFERSKLALRMLDVLKLIYQNEINNCGSEFYTPDYIQYKQNRFINSNTINNPLVSVILPAYNSLQFIEGTIYSIINQKYTNWELLITDDCSTDGTWELLKEFAGKDERIRLFRLDINSGAGAARNNSIKHSKGRFIAFCDSDDQWKPDKLEKQIRFIIDNDIALSYTSHDLIDENNNLLGEVKVQEKVTYKKMLKNNYISCLTAIYDTKKLGKVFMPEIRKRQDWALWLIILKKIPYALGMQENLAIYRVRSKSISSSKFDLLKYNWNIYRKEEKFSLVHSFILISRFFYYYLKKKLQ